MTNLGWLGEISAPVAARCYGELGAGAVARSRRQRPPRLRHPTRPDDTNGQAAVRGPGNLQTRLTLPRVTWLRFSISLLRGRP